jgi:hypothetical protein
LLALQLLKLLDLLLSGLCRIDDRGRLGGRDRQRVRLLYLPGARDPDVVLPWLPELTEGRGCGREQEPGAEQTTKHRLFPLCEKTPLLRRAALAAGRELVWIVILDPGRL